MLPFHEDGSWRTAGPDPFGAQAFVGAISLAKFGSKHPVDDLKMLPGQLVWFSCVMDLAMQGDLNLKYSELRFHEVEIDQYETYIKDSRHLLTRIDLIEDDFGEAVREALQESDEEAEELE